MGSKAVLAVCGSLAALVAGTVIALVAVPASRHESVGEWMLVQEGRMSIEHYATAADVPAAERPAWMPADAHDVTVKRPLGRDAGSAGHEVKVDFTTAPGFPLPADCRMAVAYAQPFDGGGFWPVSALRNSHDCGAWRIGTRGDRVYGWQGSAPTPDLTPTGPAHP